LPPVPGHIDCGGDPTEDSLDCESHGACTWACTWLCSRTHRLASVGVRWNRYTV